MADVSTVKKFLDLDGLTRFKTKLLGAVVTSVNGRKGAVTLTKTDAGLGNVTNDAQVKRTEMGKAGGVATLDSGGKVPSSQLPSYVDDVLEFDNKAAFPATGETGKIYVDKATNKTYRWGGSAYVEISASIALGETSSTAYAGNKGKANADAIKALQARVTGDEEQIAGVIDDLAALDDRERQHVEGLAATIEDNGERIEEIETWLSAVRRRPNSNPPKPKPVVRVIAEPTASATGVSIPVVSMDLVSGADITEASSIALPVATGVQAGVMLPGMVTALQTIKTFVTNGAITTAEIDALFA
ncbi:MAG: hypothetical protein OSJ46_06300 [Duncaniella sp.]|nr:hypothetical protein [Duncaniella sp.]